MRYVCASYMERAVQQKRSMVQSGTIRGVDVNTMQEFIAIVLAAKERAKLPPDAKWYILHPDGRKITYWDTSMRILAAFYFWQVCGTCPLSVHCALLSSSFLSSSCCCLCAVDNNQHLLLT